MFLKGACSKAWSLWWRYWEVVETLNSRAYSRGYLDHWRCPLEIRTDGLLLTLPVVLRPSHEVSSALPCTPILIWCLATDPINHGPQIQLITSKTMSQEAFFSLSVDSL